MKTSLDPLALALSCLLRSEAVVCKDTLTLNQSLPAQLVGSKLSAKDSNTRNEMILDMLLLLAQNEPKGAASEEALRLDWAPPILVLVGTRSLQF